MNKTIDTTTKKTEYGNTSGEGSLSAIAALTKTYSMARQRLTSTTSQIREARRQAARRYMPALKVQVEEAARAAAALKNAVAANPRLFDQPRARVFFGIKVGYRKMPGRLVCDEPRAIERIRKLYPEREVDLVRVSESLVRAALKQLDAKTLAALGVSIAEVEDRIVISADNDDIDKLVEALLDDVDESDRAA